MNIVNSFDDFLREADEAKGKEGDAPAEPTIDPDKEKLRDFEINGKSYSGVLSTFNAIAKKQEAMGVSEVGVISLPGDDAAYKIYKK